MRKLTKQHFLFLAICVCFLSFTPNVTNNGRETGDFQIVHFQEDTVSLIRNPAMGWGIYYEYQDDFKEVDRFWKNSYIREAAMHYASFLYIRAYWNNIEPKEGQYAWNTNENFKSL